MPHNTHTEPTTEECILALGGLYGLAGMIEGSAVFGEIDLGVVRDLQWEAERLRCISGPKANEARNKLRDLAWNLAHAENRPLKVSQEEAKKFVFTPLIDELVKVMIDEGGYTHRTTEKLR